MPKTEYEVDARLITYITTVIEADSEDEAREIAKTFTGDDWMYGDEKLDVESIQVVGSF